jgi:hypothetical protein
MEIETMSSDDTNDGPFVGRVRDKLLGRKLTHLEGLIGYQFPASFFRKKHLAQALRVSPAQLSRKLVGDDPIHYRELSEFVHRFRIGPKLDYTVFLGDLEGFEQALRDAAIGTHAGPLPDGRQALYRRRISGSPRIRIRRVGSERRSAGIGPRTYADDALADVAAFDELYIDIDAPGDGEIVVLNERIGKEMVWLRPSSYSTSPIAGASVLRIPDGAGTSSAFWARPPLDYYRIYAFWLAPGHDWTPSLGAGPTADLREANDAELLDLNDHLERVPPNRQMVMVADYRVR